MAFWMDPFIMFGVGLLIAALTKRVAPDNPHVSYVLGAVTMLITYVIAIGLFVNFAFLEPIWETLGAESGTEFMLNGVVFSIAESGVVWTELGATTMFLSILAFTTYPLYLAVGVGAGYVLFGRTPAQEGLVGLVRPDA
jgi:hypothetical protein